MKVVGFTFIRNAIKFDYPIEEAIRSILPLCQEIIVAVGASEDDTLALIKSIDPDKIKIVETIWDDSLRKGGKVLASETNKAFAAIPKDADWAFYIQGDEVIHEKYLSKLKSKMLQYKDDERVDGLLFKYLHFYGSYDFIATASNWYKHEIRAIKNDRSIYSYRDAQGFRKGDNQKLKVVPIDAYIYHYGWVKHPKFMQQKQENFQKLWHDDDWISQNVVKAEEFNYEKNISELARFMDDHPKVMMERINKVNWKFDHDPSFNKKTIKDKVKEFLKVYMKIDLSYKNYEIL